MEDAGLVSPVVLVLICMQEAIIVFERVGLVHERLSRESKGLDEAAGNRNGFESE